MPSVPCSTVTGWVRDMLALLMDSLVNWGLACLGLFQFVELRSGEVNELGECEVGASG